MEQFNPASQKGIDDLILNGGTTQVLKGEEARKMVRKAKISSKKEGCKKVKTAKGSSIKSRASDEEKEGPFKVIMNLFEEVGEAFVDQFNEPYIGLPERGVLKPVPIGGTHFTDYAHHIFPELTGNGLSDGVLKMAVSALSAKARLHGPKRTLNDRVALHDGDYYYDLGPGVIRIGKKGYDLVTNPPMLFRPSDLSEDQVIPRPGGSLRDLHKFVNLVNEEDFMLLEVFLVAAFVPEIAHPILCLHGDPGSAKTTVSRMIQSLIDPSQLTDLPTYDIEEFSRMAGQSYLLPLDNQAPFNRRISDFLCKCVTGATYSKRKLFTDNQNVKRTYRRVVIINGIELVLGRSDLLDRAIVLKMSRISETGRRPEQELWAGFWEKKPEFLHEIFTTLAKAREIYSTIQVPGLPRMADFAKWGCAIAKALGYTQDQFLGAYKANAHSRVIAALEAEPFIEILTAYCEINGGRHEGTATKISRGLRDFARAGGYDMSALPKNASQFGRMLESQTLNLRSAGWTIERNRGREREICISLPPIPETE